MDEKGKTGNPQSLSDLRKELEQLFHHGDVKNSGTQRGEMNGKY
jgi:hypothetical protein